MTDKQKFYSVVDRFPCLQPFWNQDKHELRRDAFEKRLGTMSSGEYQLAIFMANVWFHQDEYEFSIFDALGTVSGRYKQVIADWVREPYWP